MIDTKKAREFAEGIFRYTTSCDNAAKMIDDLAYEVDRLRAQILKMMGLNIEDLKDMGRDSGLNLEDVFKEEGK